MSRIIVVNEKIIGEVSDIHGIATMLVLNGNWYVVIDWMAKTYWPQDYPTNIQPITNWRDATPEELFNLK